MTKENLAERAWLVDTVRERPDMLAADASIKRLELADAVDVLALGADMAETIRPGNSAKGAMAQQLAAGGALAMKLAAKAADFLVHARSSYRAERQQVQSTEAARCAAAATRMMEAYQRGLLTLERLRKRGRQTVVLQYVAVGDGGKVVVARAVATGGAPHGGGAAG